MTPNYNPTMERTSTTMEVSTKGNARSPLTVTSQTWQRSGSCPQGTIPIRRMQKLDLLKADSPKEYGRKKPRFSHWFQHLDGNLDSFFQQENHSVAILIAQGFAYYGAQGDIKVDYPFVESDDYSSSQVSLKNGNYTYYEAIESGWAVNPRVYGDMMTRLFVYWTVDSSNTTGCFDLICPGFVQTSNEVALGAAIYPFSNSTGLPYQITVYIYKDEKTGNWWVQCNGMNIGYWPQDLFNALRYHAVSVEWGGEVYSPKIGRTYPGHTATAMGNGQFPTWGDDYGYCKSGCVKRMRVVGNDLDLRFPEFVNAYANEYRCYNVFYVEDYVEDPEFYYGGPGKSLWCP